MDSKQDHSPPAAMHYQLMELQKSVNFSRKINKLGVLQESALYLTLISIKQKY